MVPPSRPPAHPQPRVYHPGYQAPTHQELRSLLSGILQPDIISKTAPPSHPPAQPRYMVYRPQPTHQELRCQLLGGILQLLGTCHRQHGCNHLRQLLAQEAWVRLRHLPRDTKQLRLRQDNVHYYYNYYNALFPSKPVHHA